MEILVNNCISRLDRKGIVLSSSNAGRSIVYIQEFSTTFYCDTLRCIYIHLPYIFVPFNVSFAKLFQHCFHNKLGNIQVIPDATVCTLYQIDQPWVMQIILRINYTGL